MLTIAALIAAQPAAADFRIADGTSQIAARSVSMVVGEIGDRPDKIRPAPSKGEEIPLSAALRELAPEGWRGYNKGASMEHKVSWERTGTWVEALGQIMKQSGNRAVVDWGRKSVTIYPDVRKTSTIDKSQTKVKSRNEGDTSNKWALRAGREIDKELAGWAQKGGWALHWQLPKSWAVVANAEFDGSFQDAITKVIESLYAEGKPIRMKLWEGNRVAEVYSSDVK